MKIFNIIVVIALIALTAAVAPAGVFAAAIINNGSFENGSTSGWSAVIPPTVGTQLGGDISVASSYSSVNGSFTPKDGALMAILYPAQAEVFTSLSQSMNADAGDQINGWAFFVAEDSGTGYDDYGQVMITSDTGSVIATLFSASVSSVGTARNTGWVAFSYTFSTAGTYVLQARVANRGDYKKDSILAIDGVQGVGVLPPTCSAGGPYTVNEGGAVQLSGSGSDPNGGVVSYYWDLNEDGVFEITGLQNPVFSAANIAAPAVKTVTLKITTLAGGVATSTAMVTVNNVIPQLEAGNDSSVLSGSYYTGIVTYIHPGPATVKISIDYGDGSEIEEYLVPATGSASNSFALNHQYVLPSGVTEATYIVTVTIDDLSGGVATDSLTINVLNPNLAPVIFPIEVNTAFYEGESIIFAVIAQDPQNLPVEITGQDLPEGAALSGTGGIAGTYKYQAIFSWQPGCGDAGVYNLVFTAANTLGLSNNVNLIMTVVAPPPVVVTGGPYIVEKGTGVTLDGSASYTPRDECGVTLESYEWDINSDGEIDFFEPVVTLTEAELEDLGLTAADVEYPVKLTVTDSEGVSSVQVTYIKLYNTYPIEIAVEGNGAVTLAPDLPKYTAGAIVTLTAVPATGYVFSEWQGALTGTDNPANFTVNGDATITAVFTVMKYSLTIEVIGNGTVEKSPDAAEYDYGTEATLTAVAEEGYYFDHWEGALDSTDNPAILLIDGAKTLTAVFAPVAYGLTIDNIGNGEVTVDPSQTTYYRGDVVTLTAVAGQGYTFSHWEGDLTGTQNPGTVTIEGNTFINAVFTINNYTLSIDVSGNGTVEASPSAAEYEYGTTVELTAVADEGYYFDHWEGDITGNANPVSVTIDGDKNITAVFDVVKLTYTLDVTVEGNGTVARSPAGSTFTAGTVVTLTATPATGYVFSHWEGSVTGSDNPTTLTMDANKSFTAVFMLENYAIAVETTGNGTVNIEPAQEHYHYGDEVVITATAAAGYTFSRWEGDVTGSINPLTVTIDGDKTIAAVFTINVYALTVNVSGNGTVNKSPEAEVYEHGTVVTMTAIPATGYKFQRWEGALTGTVNPATLTVDAAKMVTAIFTATGKLYPVVVTVKGEGAVSLSPAGGSYPRGTAVTLTAIPAEGWYFYKWSGDASGKTNPLTITVKSDTRITATFKELPTYRLTVDISGSGTVVKSPNATNYPENTVVTLTAVPAEGWSFVRWEGNLSSTANPATITMSKNMKVTAVFSENLPPIPAGLYIKQLTINWNNQYGNSGNDCDDDDDHAWSIWNGWGNRSAETDKCGNFGNNGNNNNTATTASFHATGRIVLPAGMTHADFQSNATVTLSITSGTVTDTVTFFKLGTVWTYSGSGRLNGVSLDVEHLSLWWAPQGSRWDGMAGFVLSGDFKMPAGVNGSVQPPLVTLSLGLTGNNGGAFTPGETVECRVSGQSSVWQYNWHQGWGNFPYDF